VEVDATGRQAKLGMFQVVMPRQEDTKTDILMEM
jgi:hypothetical protein